MKMYINKGKQWISFDKPTFFLIIWLMFWMGIGAHAIFAHYTKVA